MLPNLFVIGAAKAGTTSLQHYLAQHPEIYMSPVKEPNFFAFDGAVPAFNGPSTNGSGTRLHDRLRRERYEFSVVDAPTYEQLFAHAGRRPVRGDCSPAYLHFPDTAARIKAAVPEAKIVAILRHRSTGPTPSSCRCVATMPSRWKPSPRHSRPSPRVSATAGRLLGSMRDAAFTSASSCPTFVCSARVAVI